MLFNIYLQYVFDIYKYMKYIGPVTIDNNNPTNFSVGVPLNPKHTILITNAAIPPNNHNTINKLTKTLTVLSALFGS